MKKRITWVLALLAVGLFIQLALAQEVKEELWLVAEETVKPDMVEQYEETSKQLLLLCKEEDFPYNFNVWKKGYYTYDLWYPIEDLNDIKNIEDAWDEIMQKFGEENHKRFQACIESQFDRVMAIRPDLSYQPDSAVLDETYFKFSRLQELYVKKGSEKVMEDLFKRANALYAEKGIKDVYFRGEGRIGYELPVYFSWSYGTNQIDLIKQGVDRQEMLGEKWKSLNAEMQTHMKRIEVIEDEWINILSYQKEAP